MPGSAMADIWPPLAAGALSAALSLLIWRKAASVGLVAVADERSAHSGSVATGGGLAVVLAASAALLYARPADVLWLAWFWPLAAVGLVDDMRPQGAALRLAVQAAAAAGVLWVLASGHALPPWGWPLAMLALVWMVNITNFMDGTDGLVAVQVIFALAAAAWLGDVGTSQMLVLAAAAGGFALFNLPPARLFMGDVGSTSMGLALGLGWLCQSADDGRMFWVWLILMAVFVVDSTLTMAWRAALGRSIWRAHNEHIYQQLARRAGHGMPLLLLVAINLAWLLPLAVAVARGLMPGPAAAALGYAPLAAAALRVRMGGGE